ncbi:MAG: LysM peptidoglycan-binding domain-containing protein [Bacilli bacterium]
MYKVYQVKIGDSLDNIAKSHNITIDMLRQLNGNINNIMNGQNIVVPFVEKGIYEAYLVQKGDSIYSIAQRYNIDIDDLLAINGLNKNDYIYPNQQLMVPRQNVIIYVTKPNDSIQKIINKFQVTPTDLLEQNSQIVLIPQQVITYAKKEKL